MFFLQAQIYDSTKADGETGKFERIYTNVRKKGYKRADKTYATECNEFRSPQHVNVAT